MRRLSYQCVRVVVVFSVVFSLGAAPAENRDLPREKRDPFARIVKVVKKVIRSLGDGLTTPTP
jgi:hypothetical protein